MTIDSAYQLELYNLDNAREYFFEFESIGATTFILWVDYLDNGVPARVSLSPGTGDFDIEFEGRDPIYKRGKITLTDQFFQAFEGLEITRLTMQRKTPIFKDVTFEASGAWSSEGFEFEIDKICLIQQEIEGHYCDCREQEQGLDPIENVVEEEYYEQFPECEPPYYSCSSLYDHIIATGGEVWDFTDFGYVSGIPTPGDLFSNVGTELRQIIWAGGLRFEDWNVFTTDLALCDLGVTGLAMRGSNGSARWDERSTVSTDGLRLRNVFAFYGNNFDLGTTIVLASHSGAYKISKVNTYNKIPDVGATLTYHSTSGLTLEVEGESAYGTADTLVLPLPADYRGYYVVGVEVEFVDIELNEYTGSTYEAYAIFNTRLFCNGEEVSKTMRLRIWSENNTFDFYEPNSSGIPRWYAGGRINMLYHALVPFGYDYDSVYTALKKNFSDYSKPEYCIFPQG